MYALPDQRELSQPGTSKLLVWARRLLILLTILAVIALVAVVVWGAEHVITCLLIVIIAALIAYAIVPVIEFFHKIMPRALAILLAYLCVIIILGAILYFVVSTAVFQISLIVRSITFWLTPGRSGQSPLLALLLKTGLSQAQITALREQIRGGLSGVAASLASGLVPLLGGVASGLLNILLTVVISIYLLVDGARAVRWLRKMTPSSRRGQIGSTLDTLQQVVGGYIRGQILLCTVIGFLVGAGLFLIGFPFAVLMGVVTFITEFIPVLGTLIAGTLAILLALTQGWTMTITVLVFFILMHLLEGYVLAPRLVGKSVQLHPVIMLIALTAGAELFGPFGAIFAAPTAGLLQALFTALWIQYRQAHKEEFLDDEQEPTAKQLEELQVSAATPTTPVSNDNVTGGE
jgi:predicted PurR-regulated permease PerM